MRFASLDLSGVAIPRFARSSLPRDRRFAPAANRLWTIAGQAVPGPCSIRVETMAGGVALRTAFWPARVEEPRGTVWLLQGRADCMEKYAEAIEELLQRGFAVTGFDWRGQGGSQRLHPDPRRNHLDSFAPLVDDLIALVSRRRRMPEPFFALAHSMGANILLQALTLDPDLFAAAVVTAPMIALSPRLAPRGARRIIKTAAALGLGGLPLPGGRRDGEATAPFVNGNRLTSCRRRYAMMRKTALSAPQLGVGRPTFGWVRAAMAGMETLDEAAEAGALATPLLAVAGADDRVTCARATQAFCARLDRARFVRIENCAHEILHEQNAIRDQFWRAFDEFVAEQLTKGSRARSALLT